MKFHTFTLYPMCYAIFHFIISLPIHLLVNFIEPTSKNIINFNSDCTLCNCALFISWEGENLPKVNIYALGPIGTPTGNPPTANRAIINTETQQPQWQCI